MKTAIKNVQNLIIISKALGNDVYKDLEYLAEQHEKMLAALDDCLEYFEQRQDADYDQDGHVPNDEMKMAVMIRQAIGV